MVSGLALAHPYWVFAQTMIFGHTRTRGLIVYRSPMLPDADDLLIPVTEFLAKVRHELIGEITCPDPGMMFGRAIVSVYKFLDDLDQPVEIPPVHEMFTERGLMELGLLPCGRSSHA